MRYKLWHYAVLIVFAMLMTCCNSSENITLSKDARKPKLFNSTNYLYEQTRRFSGIEIGPELTLTYIVIEANSIPGEAAKKADNCFMEIANAFKKSSKTNLFAEQGVLIYATPNDSLVQIRVGEQLERYLMMRGVTAGTKYISLQNKGKETGIDNIIPIMTKDVWDEIEHLHNHGFWEKLQIKVSITWIGDVLYSIGKPSDSLMGKIPSFTNRFIGKIAGETHSMLLTVCIIALLLWLMNVLCEKFLDETPETDKDTVLIGHIQMDKLVFWVKLILNIVIITPTLGTFTYFSNMRTEDILYLEAHNMPFAQTVDWESMTTSSAPSTFIIFMLGILFFLNYILSPHRLWAYIISSGDDIGLLCRNHTLRDQCVDITRKGKWDYRLFLGALALVVLWEILHFLIVFILGIVAYLCQFLFNNDSEITESSTISESNELTPSENPSIGGSGGPLLHKHGGGPAPSLPHGHSCPHNIENGSTQTEDVYQNKNTEHLNYHDDNNLSKTMMGMGLTQAIAAKLPNSFFKEPFKCIRNRVVKEGIILSCILILATPLLFNAAFATFFAIYSGVCFTFSLIYEFIYSNFLKNHPNIYLRYSKDDEPSIASYLELLQKGNFWNSTIPHFLLVAFLSLMGIIAIPTFAEFVAENLTNEKIIKTTEATVESENTIPQDLTGLYFVPRADGEDAKGVTARLLTDDTGNYIMQVYSDKPIRRIPLVLNKKARLFHSDILGDGYITYDKQTKSIKINFSDLWILTN